MDKIHTLLRINKNMSTLRAVELLIFLLSVGEGMTAPAIPLLGKDLGASYSMIGFFMTGYSAAYGVMTVISGRLSDRFGRRKILASSIIFCLLASIGYCFSRTVGSVLLFRTTEGMSRGALWVALEATLADHTSEKGRSAAAGRFAASYGAGAMLGCLIGGGLMQYLTFNLVFPFYPLLSIFSLFVALKGIIEIPDDKGGKHFAGSTALNHDWLQEIKNIWPVCYVFFTYTGFLYSLWGLLSMVAAYFQVNFMGIGIIFAVFWGFRIVAFLGTEKGEQIFGRKAVLMGGIISASISAALFISAGSFFLLAAGAVFGGIGTGIIFTLSIALVADSASPGYRGFAMGVMECAGSLGMVVQTALSGIFGEWGGVQFTYLFTLVVCLIGVAVTAVYIEASS